MTAIIQNLYKEYQEALPHADPITRDWFLLNSTPIYVWLLTGLYLLVVWLGPKYMANRPAYSLQTFMVVYNLGLVVLSAYMVIEIILSSYEAEYGFLCAPYNEETRKHPAAPRVAAVMWWYFVSKAIEFMDTFCMILRKKNRQITFLHVFHHMSMFNIWWWVCMWTPGGLAFFGACLNSLVHVVMYAYYGLAAIPSLREKLWWKKYITKFQLTQFVFTLWHTLQSYYGCDFPLWGKNLLTGYMIVMLALFMNFYYKSYMVKSKLKDRKKQTSTSNGTILVKHDNGAAIQNGNGRTYNNNANGIKKEL